MSWWLTALPLHEVLYKVRHRLIPNIRHLPKSRIRVCGACQAPTLILALGGDGEFHVCMRCRANQRYEMMARYLREAFPHIGSMDVLELDYASPLQRHLCNARSYMRSFYRDEVSPGTVRDDGAVCQDITKLTHADESLDLIVSSDVLEHVPDVAAAFRESNRVLRPGGAHVFTVPARAATRQRAIVRNGSTVHLTAPEYHRDPLSRSGILAYWDFGPDLPEVFASTGLTFRVVLGPEGAGGRVVWEGRKG